MSLPDFGVPEYGITRTLTNVSMSEALDRTTAALETEGFGVLFGLDIQQTLKNKLDAEISEYRILGACSPALAHQALTADPAIGLLMPCNVVLAVQADGSLCVSAIDPVALFGVLNRPDLEEFSNGVRAQLVRALSRI